MREDRLALIVDGNNYSYRGHFASKVLTTKEGFPTSAIKGFFNILLADIATLRPTYVVVHFDAGGKTFRHELYPDYKVHRDVKKKKGKEKEELEKVFKQMPVIRKILEHIGIKVVAIRGHEADDTIGTYARRFTRKGVRVVIASKDKDFAQLVSSDIFLLDPNTRQLNGVEYIKDKFGVPPEQFIELLTLTGDSSDNIPGVHKCGVKTAAKLLTTYGSIKKCKANEKKMTPSLRLNFAAAKPLFKITRKLVTINQHVECGVSRKKTRIGQLKDKKKLKLLCDRLEMPKLYKQIVRSKLNESG